MCLSVSDRKAGGVTFLWLFGFLETLSISLSVGLSALVAVVLILSLSLGEVDPSLRLVVVLLRGLPTSDILGTRAALVLSTVVLHVPHDRGHRRLVSRSMPQSPLAA